MRDRRDDVIRAHWELAVRLSGETIETLATRAVELYHARTPARARHVPFQALDANPYDALRANALHVRRFLGMGTPTTRLPAELEEALVLALPQPFQRECLRELAARVGLLAAREPQPGDCALTAPADLMRECAETITALAPALADGRFTAEDAPALRAALACLADVHGAAHSLMSQIQHALNPVPVREGTFPRAPIAAGGGTYVSEVDPS